MGQPIGGASAAVPGAGIGLDDSIRIYKNASSKVARTWKPCLAASAGFNPAATLCHGAPARSNAPAAQAESRHTPIPQGTPDRRRPGP